MVYSYYVAIKQPEKGIDELIYQDGYVKVYRKDNHIEVEALPLRECLIYE
jgi:hypothetical protein